jgi:hypothetical protein
MTGIETALLVGATAVTAVGQVMAGNGAAAAQGFNARLAEAQAVQTQYQAGAEQAAVQRQLRQRQEAARAGAAGSGIDIASGSALDVFADNAAEMELEAQTRRWQGQMKAQALRAQAAQDRAAASASRIGGYVGGRGDAADGRLACLGRVWPGRQRGRHGREDQPGRRRHQRPPGADLMAFAIPPLQRPAWPVRPAGAAHGPRRGRGRRADAGACRAAGDGCLGGNPAPGPGHAPDGSAGRGIAGDGGPGRRGRQGDGPRRHPSDDPAAGRGHPAEVAGRPVGRCGRAGLGRVAAFGKHLRPDPRRRSAGADAAHRCLQCPRAGRAAGVDDAGGQRRCRGGADLRGAAGGRRAQRLLRPDGCGQAAAGFPGRGAGRAGAADGARQPRRGRRRAGGPRAVHGAAGRPARAVCDGGGIAAAGPGGAVDRGRQPGRGGAAAAGRGGKPRRPRRTSSTRRAPAMSRPRRTRWPGCAPAAAATATAPTKAS